MTRIKSWDELTIQDNFLFQKVMRNQRLCKHLIEKILQIKIQKITYPVEEKVIDIRLDSKSVRLDVYVQDEKGTVFDIEMQCSSGPNHELAKRTRYYQAMIDMDVLSKGALYEELNPSYIIFICTFDLFHLGLPIYTFRNRCAEQPDLELEDGATKIFLNSKGHTDHIDPDIAAFLRYVDGKAAEGTFIHDLDTEVRRIKQHDETRREYMTLAMELERQNRAGYLKGRQEGWQEGHQEGEKKGEQKGIVQSIIGMLNAGITIEIAAKATNYPVEKVQEIARQNHLI